MLTQNVSPSQPVLLMADLRLSAQRGKSSSHFDATTSPAGSVTVQIVGGHIERPFPILISGSHILFLYIRADGEPAVSIKVYRRQFLKDNLTDTVCGDIQMSHIAVIRLLFDALCYNIVVLKGQDL